MADLKSQLLRGAIAIEPGRTAEVQGSLFDMNSFFQRLVSRFLHGHLPSDEHIQDERSVHGLLAVDFR